MREKLRAALAAIAWEPPTQVRKAGGYYIAIVNIRGKTQRGISTDRADAVRRALVGVGK